LQTSLIALLINTACIIGGSGLGLLLHKGIRKEITDMVLIGIGLYVVYLGITSLSSDTNAVVLVLSIALGVGLGAALDLDGKLERLAKKAEDRLVKNKKDGEESHFAEGLVGFFLVSCVGAFVVIACFNCGMGDPSMVYTMCVMDVFTTLAMASALGIGVMVAVVPVMAYRSLLVLLAGFLAPLMSDVMLDAFACVGGMICIPIGLNMMGVTHFKVASFLPVLVFAPLLAWAWGLF